MVTAFADFQHKHPAPRGQNGGQYLRGFFFRRRNGVNSFVVAQARGLDFDQDFTPAWRPLQI